MRETVTDNGVSSGARHLFHILKDFARGKNWPECWPGKWRLAEETGRSVRMVQYYLRELVIAGAIEAKHDEGKRNRYRILLSVSERISDKCTETPLQPIAGVGMQPIAGVPLQPIAGVDICASIYEADTQQAAQGTEAPAAAAEENFQGEEMVATTKNAFDELVKLGMPASAEMQNRISFNPDFARDVLRHCKRRFGKGRKPVDNPGGYIAALLCNPAKFGWVQRDGIWCDPEKPSGVTDEERCANETARKAMWAKERLQRQTAAEEFYADSKAMWEWLPQEVRAEIEDLVRALPLFHKNGTDKADFFLCCLGEMTTTKRIGLMLKWNAHKKQNQTAG